MAYDKNKRLRNVSLHSCRFVTKQNHDGKKRIVVEAWKGGTNFWSELETPRVIMDIFANMTDEEYQGFLKRIYPENVPS